jgi:hypothetical protein
MEELASNIPYGLTMKNRVDFQQHIGHYGERLRYFISVKYVTQLPTSKKKEIRLVDTYLITVDNN